MLVEPQRRSVLVEKQDPIALVELRSVVTLARLRFEHLAVLGLAEIARERTGMLPVRRGIVDQVELPLATEPLQFAPDPERDLVGGLRRFNPQHRLTRRLRGLELDQVERIAGRV